MEIKDSAHATGSPLRTSTTQSTTPLSPVKLERTSTKSMACFTSDPIAGRMLEVITVEDIEDGEVAIHAMRLHKTYERYLPREDRP